MINSIREIGTRLSAIAEIKNKVAFNHFSESKTLPFAVYDFSQSSQGADDLHSVLKTSVTISLYQETRNFALEKKMLKAFSDVAVNTYSDYISDERMYLTEFDFEFFEKI